MRSQVDCAEPCTLGPAWRAIFTPKKIKPFSISLNLDLIATTSGGVASLAAKLSCVILSSPWFSFFCRSLWRVCLISKGDETYTRYRVRRGIHWSTLSLPCEELKRQNPPHEAIRALLDCFLKGNFV